MIPIDSNTVLCNSGAEAYNWILLFSCAGIPGVECTSDSQCGGAEACVSQRCVSACAGACGTGALCDAVEHRARCHCPPGTAGNPARICYTRKPNFAAIHFHCHKRLDSFIMFFFLQLNVHQTMTVLSTSHVSTDTVKTRARSVRHADETRTAWQLRISLAAVARPEPRVTRGVHAFQPSVTTTKIVTTHKSATD